MKFKNIYIISWFGDNDTVDRRIKFHDNQLAWCFKHNLQPVVLAQNYKQEYYRENVHYIKHNGTILRPGQARNVLLKHFYNSDEDFAIFADNDVYLYEGEKYGANDIFVKTMKSCKVDQFDHIDCFYPLNPAFVPFSKDLEKNKISDTISWRMKPGYIAACFFVLKNLKKYHNKEIYYDDAFVLPDGSMLPAEDQDFPINMIHNNMSCFLCPNIIKKDEGHNSISTWSPTDKEVWKKRCLDGLNFIAEKWNLPKITTLAPSSLWLKHLKLRNHKLRDTKVYFKSSTFGDLFE